MRRLMGWLFGWRRVELTDFQKTVKDNLRDATDYRATRLD